MKPSERINGILDKDAHLVLGSVVAKAIIQYLDEEYERYQAAFMIEAQGAPYEAPVSVEAHPFGQCWEERPSHHQWSEEFASGVLQVYTIAAELVGMSVRGNAHPPVAVIVHRLRTLKNDGERMWAALVEVGREPCTCGGRPNDRCPHCAALQELEQGWIGLGEGSS